MGKIGEISQALSWSSTGKAIDLLSSDNEFIYEGAVKEVRDFRNVNRYLYLLSEVLLICRAKKTSKRMKVEQIVHTNLIKASAVDGENKTTDFCKFMVFYPPSLELYFVAPSGALCETWVEKISSAARVAKEKAILSAAVSDFSHIFSYPQEEVYEDALGFVRVRSSSDITAAASISSLGSSSSSSASGTLRSSGRTS